MKQVVRLKDGAQLKLHIWDTGGQERFRAMLPLYYRDSAGALIVFDVTSAPSFDAVKFWAEELQQKGPPGVSMYAVANKIDLPERNLDFSEVNTFCEGNKMKLVECSAKTGENINRLFEMLAEDIYQQLKNS
eukprot:Filipodium_phascolosomae@DN242_c0_g1_i1.p1